MSLECNKWFFLSFFFFDNENVKISAFFIVLSKIVLTFIHCHEAIFSLRRSSGQLYSSPGH